jgi:RNA polymerase sigma-70 factor (family 1)
MQNINKDYFLLEKLKKGDSKAYSFLMDSYYKRLCGYANSLTNDIAKSEDIVQNIFVKIWVNRKKISSDIQIKNYLYKSVYNEFIDQYRKNKPLVYLEKKHIKAVNQIVNEKDGLLDNLILKLDSEIEKLPKKCKNIFLLNKKDGLTHTEIADYMNISVKTVEGHMSRAFKILNDSLGCKIKKILFILFNTKKTKSIL